MEQQQRSQRKSASYVARDNMSFLVCAILRWRLSAPGNAHLTDRWRDVVCDWPNFHAPSMSVVNLDEVNLLCLGHHPKMFLFLLEEMVYAYAHIGTDDANGLWVLAYEVLAMAEMWYRLRKRSPNPQDTTWVLGDLTGLERLMWAIFDSALAAGASPELGPNESWEQVVHGIFDKLVYIGGNPSDRCPTITVGAKDMQEPSILGGGACNVQPPPGLRAHPEYQQGVPSTLCKINSFGSTPKTSGVPKEVGRRGLFRMG